ncbi:MAG: hypothetical protein QOE02_3759 [Rhodospirillaceae bacterium]|jgi:hypothetical protein|nr:hypothetical protein [Rhodospirillaceae bacterium]
MSYRRLIEAAVVAVSLGACAQPGAPAVCTAPLKPAREIDLYFGRDKQGGGEVSEAEWASFLTDTVTPRFPDGLSVLNVEGQARESSGRIVRERTKLLVVVVFDAPAHQGRVREIVQAYNGRFGQHGVFWSEHPVCAGI